MKTYKRGEIEVIAVCHACYDGRDTMVLIEVGTGDIQVFDADRFEAEFSEIRELEISEMQDSVSKRLSEILVSKMFGGLFAKRNWLEYNTANVRRLVLSSDSRYAIITSDDEEFRATFRGQRIANGTLDHCKSMIDLHIRSQ